MPNIQPTQFSENSVPRHDRRSNGQRTLRSGRQDNPAHLPAPPGTLQPAPPKNTTRTAPKRACTTTTHQKKNRRGKDVQLNLWVRPVVKAELERVAKREGVSVSAAGEALLENALQQTISTQYAALLEPIINKAIGKHMRSYSNRLAVLLVRSLFASEQARSYAINILGRLPGMTDTDLNDIKHGANNTARANITRVTPQMKTLLDAVQQWLEEAEKGGVVNA